MTQYLLDTNHASALLRGNAALWARLRMLHDAEVGLCMPSIGELWFMILNSARVAENRLRLEQLIASLAVWEFDARAAEEYGHIRVELRRSGTPIPAVDVLIAAIARNRDLILLSSDKHFNAIQRLKVENWLGASTSGQP